MMENALEKILSISLYSFIPLRIKLLTPLLQSLKKRKKLNTLLVQRIQKNLKKRKKKQKKKLEKSDKSNKTDNIDKAEKKKSKDIIISTADITNPTPATITPTTDPPPPITTNSILSQDVRTEIIIYRSLLQSTLLGTNKVSVDIKKLLAKHRNDNGISLADHLQLLGQFGWTPDEYELGEKEQEDVDLEIEREILKNPNGFQIISITSSQSNPKEEIVWSKVTAKFFQTTKKGKANYTIEKIELIVNTSLKRAFDQKRNELSANSKARGNVQWGFHGNIMPVLRKVAEEGFKPPEDSVHKAVLATGFYFSLFSDYAIINGKGLNQVLVCSLLPGETYQCQGKVTNDRSKQDGFDSNYSANGTGIIVFDPPQILPKYIVSFSVQEAKERVQED